jgi:hypothetical protein
VVAAVALTGPERVGVLERVDAVAEAAADVEAHLGDVAA